MARIRTIKPEFFSDNKTARCSRDARLLFIGMLIFADDNGVIPADGLELKMKIFPGDACSLEEIDKWTDELSRVGLVQLFEVDGTEYMWIPGFLRHQRIDRPACKYPITPEIEARIDAIKDGANSPNRNDVQQRSENSPNVRQNRRGVGRNPERSAKASSARQNHRGVADDSTSDRRNGRGVVERHPPEGSGEERSGVEGSGGRETHAEVVDDSADGSANVIELPPSRPPSRPPAVAGSNGSAPARLAALPDEQLRGKLAAMADQALGKGEREQQLHEAAERLASRIESHPRCRNQGSPRRREELAERIEADGEEYVSRAVDLLTSPAAGAEMQRLWEQLVRFPDGVRVDESGNDRLEAAHRLQGGQTAQPTDLPPPNAAEDRRRTEECRIGGVLLGAFRQNGCPETRSREVEQAAVQALRKRPGEFENLHERFDLLFLERDTIASLLAKEPITADDLLAAVGL